jgi:hypothetical protein
MRKNRQSYRSKARKGQALLQPGGSDSIALEPQLLKTRHQMAARYQVSVRTIGYWVQDGTLPVYQRGAVVRFNPHECDEALKAFRRKSRWEASAEEEGGNV